MSCFYVGLCFFSLFFWLICWNVCVFTDFSLLGTLGFTYFSCKVVVFSFFEVLKIEDSEMKLELVFFSCWNLEQKNNWLVAFFGGKSETFWLCCYVIGWLCGKNQKGLFFEEVLLLLLFLEDVLKFKILILWNTWGTRWNLVAKKKTNFWTFFEVIMKAPSNGYLANSGEGVFS